MARKSRTHGNLTAEEKNKVYLRLLYGPKNAAKAELGSSAVFVKQRIVPVSAEFTLHGREAYSTEDLYSGKGHAVRIETTPLFRQRLGEFSETDVADVPVMMHKLLMRSAVPSINKVFGDEHRIRITHLDDFLKRAAAGSNDHLLIVGNAKGHDVPVLANRLLGGWMLDSVPVAERPLKLPSGRFVTMPFKGGT